MLPRNKARSLLRNHLWLLGIAFLAAGVISAMLASHCGYVMKSGRIVRADAAPALLTNPLVQRAYLGG